MSDQDQDQDNDTTGAIDTSVNGGDNSGAAPVMGGAATSPVEDDSTGVDAARGTQVARNVIGGAAGMLDPRNMTGKVQQIMQYLSGAGADHPDTIEEVGRQIDPEGKLSPSDRNLQAIHHVATTKGQDAAWKLLQSNRVAYNAQAAFANTALQGTEQKPADMDAAVHAANLAQANVPDGSNVKFTRDMTGITATVTAPGQDAAKQIQLSPEAFGAFLNPGKDGQFDKLLSGGSVPVLEKLAQQFPVQNNGGAPGEGGNAEAPQVEPNAASQRQAPAQQERYNPNEAEADKPGEVTRKEYQNPQFSGKLTPEQKREQRSYQLFPRASLDTKVNSQREAWLQGQEDTAAKLENNVDVAEARRKDALEVARVQAGGRTQSAETAGKSRENVATTNAGARTGAADINSQGRRDVATTNAGARTGAAEIAGKSRENVANTNAGAHVQGENIKAQGRVDSAKLYSQARVDAAKQHLQQMIQHEERVDARSQHAQAGRMLLGKLNAGGVKSLSPEEQDTFGRLVKASETAQPQQQRAAPAQQAAPGPGVPAAGMVKNGFKFLGGDPSKQESWQKVQ